MLILLEEPNVLILDEPGNDLDVDMLAAVEDLLDGWPGTLVLVTHDRYLMERVTDDQYAIIDGKIRHLPGGVEEYVRIMEKHRADAAELSTPKQGKGSTEGSALQSEESVGRLSNAEMRALKKQLQSVERKMETVNGRIAEAEARLRAADPTDYVALGEIQQGIDELHVQLDQLESEWLDITEVLEED